MAPQHGFGIVFANQDKADTGVFIRLIAEHYQYHDGKGNVYEIDPMKNIYDSFDDCDLDSWNILPESKLVLELYPDVQGPTEITFMRGYSDLNCIVQNFSEWSIDGKSINGVWGAFGLFLMHVCDNECDEVKISREQITNLYDLFDRLKVENRTSECSYFGTVSTD